MRPERKKTSENDLHVFFEPQSIAIIGVPRSPGFGYLLPLRLKKQGWGDRIYLVNPSGGTLHGMPLYKSIAQVPEPVDLAVVMVPAQAVPGVLEELGQCGICHVILESAGFAEVGEKGQALQEEAKSIAMKHNIRIIGPNCVGVINTANRFTTVEIVKEALIQGKTSVIAQSGVFANVMLDGLHQNGLFISKAVTLGNRIDVNECEALDYFHQDPDTQVIMMYLEGTADGNHLRQTLAQVTRDKPVLILKSGRTEAGRAATASHTGSLSGEDALYDALFSQTGAIRAESLEELVTLARVFSTQPLPKGKGLGILTASGSLGALSSDAAVSAGLKLPELTASTIDKVRRLAPDWMNVKNPLDVGPSGLFAPALTALLEDPGIDMALVITIIPYAVFGPAIEQGAKAIDFFGDIARIREEAKEKPVVLCALGHSDFIKKMSEAVGLSTPVLSSPEMAARVMAALGKYSYTRAYRADG